MSTSTAGDVTASFASRPARLFGQSSFRGLLVCPCRAVNIDHVSASDGKNQPILRLGLPTERGTDEITGMDGRRMRSGGLATTRIS
jgi:hypothetical protein